MKKLLMILLIFPALLKAEERLGPFCDRPVTKDELIYYLETGNDTAGIFNVPTGTFKQAIDAALSHTGGVMEAVKRAEVGPASWTYQESRDGKVKISQFDATSSLGYNFAVYRAPYPGEQVLKIWGKEFLSLECCNPAKDSRQTRANRQEHTEYNQRPDRTGRQEVIRTADGVTIYNDNRNINYGGGGSSSGGGYSQPAVQQVGYQQVTGYPMVTGYSRPTRASYGQYGYPSYGYGHGYQDGWYIDAGYHSGGGWHVDAGVSKRHHQHHQPRVGRSRFISTTPSSPSGPLNPPNRGR